VKSELIIAMVTDVDCSSMSQRAITDTAHLRVMGPSQRGHGSSASSTSFAQFGPAVVATCSSCQASNAQQQHLRLALL
jgi:hypothetical protein